MMKHEEGRTGNTRDLLARIQADDAKVGGHRCSGPFEHVGDDSTAHLIPKSVERIEVKGNLAENQIIVSDRCRMHVAGIVVRKSEDLRVGFDATIVIFGSITQITGDVNEARSSEQRLVVFVIVDYFKKETMRIRLSSPPSVHQSTFLRFINWIILDEEHVEIMHVSCNSSTVANSHLTLLVIHDVSGRDGQ